MKKIAFVIPYFGKLPVNFFPVWLKSCEYNPSIHFFIFTDDKTKYAYPPNVQYIYTTFTEFKERIQRLYDFEICLNNPYELCDYKVAYGEIFNKELNAYDFWGYCDIDLIWGDIRSFYTDTLLNKYDKIGYLGHATIYKNNDYINSIYKTKFNGQKKYIEFFQSPNNHFFDEIYINELFKYNNIKIYKETIFADITPLTWNFQINYGNYNEGIKNKHRIFLWNKGKLISYSIFNNMIVKDEYLYAHFLRRRMKNNIRNNIDKILIIPNQFNEITEPITTSFIIRNSQNNKVLYWTDFIRAKIRKFTPSKAISYLINRHNSVKRFQNYYHKK